MEKSPLAVERVCMKNVSKIIGIAITMFIVLANHVHGQVIQAMASIDTNAMLIGDQVKMDLKLTLPANTLYRWPLFSDTLISGIQIAERTKIDTTFSEDKKSMTLHQALKLTSFDSGFYLIPPLTFLYRTPPDTTTLVSQTETLLLKVHTIEVDTSKAIKPIKGPLSVPMTFREMLPYLLGGLLVVLIISGVVYYLRKRKKAEPVFQLRTKVELPAHEIALTALEKLRIRKLWQEGRVKEYHSELTEIVRAYMEKRFDIMALEMTSIEILSALKLGGHVTNEQLEKLNFMLTLADMVKFAKMQPLPTEHDLSMDYAVQFVKETIVKKEQIGAEDGRN